MRHEIIDGLELMLAEPKAAAHPVPLLFLHGAFAGAWVWAERFLPLFAARGYRATALSLRGHGGSERASDSDHHSIGDYVDDLATITEWLGVSPVLLGHSMGGFVVQKYLEKYRAPAAVLMSSVPPHGLIGSSLHLALNRPNLFFEINRLMSDADAPLEVWRDALFARDIAPARLRTYQRRMSVESQRALWDMTFFNLVWPQALYRTPLFVLGTEHDQLIPPFIVQSTAYAYGVAEHIFDGFGHGFMLEPGSEVIVDTVCAWLETQRY